jgi:alkylation response protein AidB-like acyl-CoA dehydrogenase
MNFDLSEDEEMLKALAERFVADRYDLERRRKWQGDVHGFSRANWDLLSELGLIAALLDAEDGGLGVDSVGLAAVFEALGRGLVVEPLIENIAIAGTLLAKVAPQAVRDEWLEPLVSGRRRIALAHREAEARRNLRRVSTVAQRNGTGTYLTGRKSMVPAGSGCDAFIVSARVSGEPSDNDGVALFLVESNTPGLAITSWRLVDGSVAVSLDLNEVCVPVAQYLGGGLSEIEAAYARGVLLQCAEALGIMEKLHGDTLDYLRTRRQFGQALGNFQALQHRMVAQYAAIEQSRALLNLAMMAVEPAAQARAIAGARAFIAEASVALGHEMIQLHGGMGVTDELSIGHGHKRLLMLSRWPEDASASLDRYASA